MVAETIIVWSHPDADPQSRRRPPWRYHGLAAADFHAHPELLYDVHRTAAAVADKAQELWAAMRVVTGIGRTGVVGVIHGKQRTRKRSARSSGPARRHGRAADPGKRPRFLTRSTVPGKMHACGHDGHTAMLLGAATLSRRDAQFSPVPRWSYSSRPRRVAPAARPWSRTA